MTTFLSLATRIRAASTPEDLAKREEQIARHYHAGTITSAEFMRLDVLCMETLTKLETLTH